jgi:hypothetical protein
LLVDELLGESLHNIPVIVGGGGTGGGGSGGGGGGGGPAGTFHHPRAPTGKLTPMQIRCKYGQLGPSKGQFNSPHGFCLGTEEDIIVADTNNHRIQVKVQDVKMPILLGGKRQAYVTGDRCRVYGMRNVKTAVSLSKKEMYSVCSRIPFILLLVL